MSETEELRPAVRPATRVATVVAGARAATAVAPLASWIAGTFRREMDAGRGFLWLPVAFSIGILGYFVAPFEPGLAAAGAILVLPLAVGFVARRWRFFGAVALVAIAAAGFFDAKLRTDVLAAPALTRNVSATLTGWVVSLEEAARGGRRAVVRVASIEGLDAADTPRNARVTIRAKSAGDLSVGDAISVRASLAPPAGPVMPGGFDFALSLYYRQIGATGFTFGGAAPADLDAPPLAVRVLKPLAHLRDTIRRRIEAALPGENGHIAAALVMGDQGGISDTTQDAMRGSGLGHILSISGFHMALVAGFVFWILRALLALSPTLALTRPIKKWAAASALAASTFYLGLSGAEVATVRSWVMLAIMLAAILMDRRALTLRNVALAAIVILVVSPESLLSISFQMSFAATIALIAGYELVTRRPASDGLADRRSTFTGRAMTVVGGLFLTALLAGAATTPFAIYYFQRAAPLTIVANMAVSSVVGFVVMPAALIAVIVMPLGLEGWPLQAMDWGLDWMIWVARTVTAWSTGLGLVPAPSAVALLLVVAGFLWLMLWGERWRLLGLIPMLLAVPVALATPRPDILVDELAEAVAVRGANGHFVILGGKGADFEVEYWLRADADSRDADAASLTAGVACDPLGCVTAADGPTVALSRRAEAFAEDCRRAAVVISSRTAPDACATRALVVDGPRLARFGAHALYAEDDGRWRIATAYPAERRAFMPPSRQPR